MFTDEFGTLLQNRKIKPFHVSKGTGISSGTMNDYATGKKKPSIENLVKIADFLNVSTDFLLGRDQNSENNSAPDDEVRSAIVSKVKQLSDSQADRLLAFLEGMLAG